MIMNPPRHRPQHHVLTRALLLVHRDEIEPYMRETFDVHKSVKKIGIKIFITVKATQWDPTNPGPHPMGAN